jgi:hypothetical protein
MNSNVKDHSPKSSVSTNDDFNSKHDVDIGSIFRFYGDDYISKHSDKLTLQHRKVIRALSLCRTGELGSCEYECQSCHLHHMTMASCGNRHCPQCQGHKMKEWVQRQEAKRLPVEYFLMTFTIPSQLRQLFIRLQGDAYRLMFKVSSEVIKEMMSREKNLGVDITGFTSLLHTWGQQLQYHPHVHVLLAGGGIDKFGEWKAFPKDFGLQVHKASALWRGKLLAGLEALVGRAQLPPKIFSKEFVVHCQSAGSGINTIKYLSRYVFRVAIDNRRIISIKDGKIKFWYKDREKGGVSRVLELDADEFIHRFLQHVLPSGFVKVRHYGFLHPNTTQDLNLLKVKILKFAEALADLIPDDVNDHLPPLPMKPPRCQCCGRDMVLVTVRRCAPFKKTG